ncbi:MAG: hypothetical protein VX681_01320 [Myxococcota bacterium]|nr:hypothetical protein [Myxococcota bacterium]
MSPSPPPDSVEQALGRAASHARNALAEALAACRAMLDAVSLVAARGPAGSSTGFAALARILEELEAQLTRSGEASQAYTAPLIGALAEALDAEIARWERRADHDPDARAVLRAFLGLRELLWELGVRGADRTGTDDQENDLQTDRSADDDPRVQRIRVHG